MKTALTYDDIQLVPAFSNIKSRTNINLKTIKSASATGVNRISVGSITHSAPAIDFKLEIN